MEGLPGFPVAAMLRQTVEELAALLQPECDAVELAALPQLDARRFFEPAEMALGAFQPGKESAPLSATACLSACSWSESDGANRGYSPSRRLCRK
jgi:hypothetical protein